ELNDADIVAIIEKMLKQRRDSITQYKAANRQDLVDVEEFEVTVLQGYMPQQLSEDEIKAVIAEVIAATGAAGPQDMGKVMGAIKPKLAGKADMGKVSGLIKAQLTK
ncbi:MAG: GatB/YqeY domain-containing protein, partial [Gammaproteobacteria bacterium]|nr:GatB/YqeY domain-containing protein [Gammaproteobacteria bacterium]